MSDRVINLLLVDDDPIFSLGLRTALQAYPDVQIIAQTETTIATLERLGEFSGDQFPDLLILELNLKPLGSGLQLCQQLKERFPNLAIFLLTVQEDAQILATAKALGVAGYASKGIAIAQLVPLLHQVATGTPAWELLPPTTLPRQTNRPNSLLTRIGNSGLQQIQQSLTEVRTQLARLNLSDIDWFYWTGRERELRTAYWVVSQLLPVEVISAPSPPPENLSQQQLKGSGGRRLTLNDSQEPNLQLRQSYPGEPITQNLREVSPSRLIIEKTLQGIQANVKNLTETPLEIDILQVERKQEILYLVVKNLEKIIAEQRFLALKKEDISEAKLQLLRDLWQSSTLDFFLKYYPSLTGIREYTIVDLIMENAPIVQTTLLTNIPETTELLAYLLFENSLIIDQVTYSANTPEAIARAEILLQNLVIQVANGVMQFLLNYFPEVELVKHNLYQPQYHSPREIANFRNNLSWQTRLQYYLEEPKDIFESKVHLYILNGRGIRKTSIYAPRQLELEELKGLRWAVTIAWELRDTISPRLRAAVAVVGKGAVYILTQVVGRAIGLIGRGIIQGIGSTLQDARYGKKSERGK